MNVEILTKNIEVVNNAHNESIKVGYDTRVRVANHLPEKILYNDIFMILIYEYKNIGFLL